VAPHERLAALPAMSATMVTSRRASTGFARKPWNPARSIRASSSGVLLPVRHTAGIAPPRSEGNIRILRISE